jgi:hypothetical protein
MSGWGLPGEDDVIVFPPAPVNIAIEPRFTSSDLLPNPFLDAKAKLAITVLSPQSIDRP